MLFGLYLADTIVTCVHRGDKSTGVGGGYVGVAGVSQWGLLGQTPAECETTEGI